MNSDVFRARIRTLHTLLDAILAGTTTAPALEQQLGIPQRTLVDHLHLLEALVAIQRWRVPGQPTTTRTIRPTSRAVALRDAFGAIVRTVEPQPDAPWAPAPWRHPYRRSA
ncbi:MAG: hypothetical protein K2R93_12260 [Gemmatimonadaceae bacterium]|nr:hypothetical protein [Gemmatimonadaceae bacterium]